jgi:hypothetical protein
VGALLDELSSPPKSMCIDLLMVESERCRLSFGVEAAETQYTCITVARRIRETNGENQMVDAIDHAFFKRSGGMVVHGVRLLFGMK